MDSCDATIDRLSRPAKKPFIARACDALKQDELESRAKGSKEQFGEATIRAAFKLSDIQSTFPAFESLRVSESGRVSARRFAVTETTWTMFDVFDSTSARGLVAALQQRGIMFGMAKAAWLPGWVPTMAERAIATVPDSVVATLRKALRFIPASEQLEERRLGTGRFFPGGLPALSTRTVETTLVAFIVLLIRSVPNTTTQELGTILLSISGAVLMMLGVAEFRTWRRWESR